MAFYAINIEFNKKKKSLNTNINLNKKKNKHITKFAQIKKNPIGSKF